MEIKSYLALRNIQQLLKSKSILVYGENKGLIDSFKNLFKKNLIDYEIIIFFQDDILRDTKILMNEVTNVSLFGKKKIFFIQEATDKIIKIIEEANAFNSDNKIIIFSNTLEKRSKLRSLYEKEKEFKIIPCYQDNEKSLSQFIYDELRGFEGLNGNAVNLLIDNSNLNRSILMNELNKIKMCFLNRKISYDKLEKLLNYKNLDNFETLRDAALLGRKEKLNKNIEKTPFLAEDLIFYLYSISSRITRLSEALLIDKENKNIQKTMSLLKPKIFWKDQETFKDQCLKWNTNKINQALSKVSDIEKKIKKGALPRTDILIKNLLVELCVEASSS